MSRIFIVLFLFLLGIEPVFGSDPFNGPWQREAPLKQEPHREKVSFNPLRFLVHIFSEYISPIDGRRCSMYPTCSRYSMQCFERHGFLMGWIMTCDRLLRCGGDEIRRVPILYRKGGVRFYDPVENNDFWWYRPQELSSMTMVDHDP
nr:membrane protein insertion efficiency factor YidD [Desulfobacterales bacterium]